MIDFEDSPGHVGPKRLIEYEYELDQHALEVIDRLTLRSSLLSDPKTISQMGWLWIDYEELLAHWGTLALIGGNSIDVEPIIERLSKKLATFKTGADERFRTGGDAVVKVLREESGLKARKTVHRRGKKIWLPLIAGVSDLLG